MANFYHKDEWLEFRNAIIERDCHACVRCNRVESDTVILQVHHKRYIQGRLPWEYQHDFCETLCKRCHAEEHGEVAPESGWEYVGEKDLVEPCYICHRCGATIRHICYIQHPMWVPMVVGRGCCSSLTGHDYAKRKRFIDSPRWKRTNNLVTISQKGNLFEIYPVEDYFMINVNGVNGRSQYKNVNEAKQKIFDILNDRKFGRFLRNPK